MTSFSARTQTRTHTEDNLKNMNWAVNMLNKLLFGSKMEQAWPHRRKIQLFHLQLKFSVHFLCVFKTLNNGIQWDFEAYCWQKYGLRKSVEAPLTFYVIQTMHASSEIGLDCFLRFAVAHPCLRVLYSNTSISAVAYSVSSALFFFYLRSRPIC